MPLYDQRGELFDRVVGGQIDMGAFELGGLFGDLNNDGVVGRDDVAIVAGAFGRRADATYGQGDLNGDRAVNLIDVLLLKRNLGAGLPSLQPSAAIGAAKSASPVERG